MIVCCWDMTETESKKDLRDASSVELHLPESIHSEVFSLDITAQCPLGSRKISEILTSIDTLPEDICTE